MTKNDWTPTAVLLPVSLLFVLLVGSTTGCAGRSTRQYNVAQFADIQRIEKNEQAKSIREPIDVTVTVPLAASEWRRLASLGLIRRLSIGSGELDKDALQTIATIGSLDHLSLAGRTITDAEMVYIAKIQSLRGLDLSQTAVTDRSVPLILDLPHLRWLDLSDTKVTSAAIRELDASRRFDFLRAAHLPNEKAKPDESPLKITNPESN